MNTQNKLTFAITGSYNGRVRYATGVYTTLDGVQLACGWVDGEVHHPERVQTIIRIGDTSIDFDKVEGVPDCFIKVIGLSLVPLFKKFNITDTKLKMIENDTPVTLENCYLITTRRTFLDNGKLKQVLVGYDDRVEYAIINKDQLVHAPAC